MPIFDLLIVGGGAAGFAAATRASEVGAKAAIINSGLPLGGTCVNVGCVPSKFLLEISSEYYNFQHALLKPSNSDTLKNPGALNFQAAIKKKNEIVTSLRNKNYTQVARVLGIQVIRGKARFISTKQIEVNGKTFEADKFIIATGSRPRILPIEGIDKVRYITNREALSLARLPKSMMVVGAGPLGMEFAQIFARFGTKVILLEKEKQILPHTEPEVAEELRRCLEEEGIGIYTDVNIELASEESGFKIVKARIGRSKKIFKSEELLLAAGVSPNSNDMGLDKAGVTADKKGFITADETMHTTSSHIWAGGDVVGKFLLETVAAKEGYIAASNALEGTKKTIDYSSVPQAVFTDPQVASVGLTEEEFMKRYKVCSCRTLKMTSVPKARIINEKRGLIKMVVHPDTGVIAGVHMVSPQAADMIHEATLAVKYKMTLQDIIDTVHVFPTMSEAIKLVAQSFKRDISKMSCCVE